MIAPHPIPLPSGERGRVRGVGILNLAHSCLPAGEFICYLACLREAPPPEALRRAGALAKAGAWDSVLISMTHLKS